jgi:hypothetical protein
MYFGLLILGLAQRLGNCPWIICFGLLKLSTYITKTQGVYMRTSQRTIIFFHGMWSLQGFLEPWSVWNVS